MPVLTGLGLDNFFIVTHPLISHKMARLRDRETSKKSFKELAFEITLLLGYEATKQIPLQPGVVQTPLAECAVETLVVPPVILPILRAGLGMVDALLTLMPTADVGHIGLYRNEKTLKPEHYYFKIPPDTGQREVFVCDPMLATGGSAAAAITDLKEKGVTKMTFICLVAAPEGVRVLANAHPDVPIYTAALDQKLNEKAYIVPGLGDAGDRLFGTV